MPWTTVARTSDIGDRGVIGVDCGAQRLAVYRVGDEYFATSDLCPHQGASLSRGCVVEGFIECPLHYALFDIRTGAADGGMTTRSVRTFPTREENGEIHVDIDA